MDLKKNVFIAGCMLLLASLACTNPVSGFFTTRTAVAGTATATMFTPTASKTNTRRPTRTTTPSVTPTKSQTKTNALVPTESPLPVDTLLDGSGTPPAPNKRTLTQTGPSRMPLNRFTETGGLTKFSYVPPPGWKKVPGTGSNLTSWSGPSQSGGVVCTLLFTVEQSDKSAADTAKDLLQTIASSEGVTIVSQGKFANDAGLDAYTMVIDMSSQGQNAQLAIFLFQKRGFLVEAGYARLLEENREQDAIVDQSMKTLQYD
jgi:hypothetical protein